VFRRIPRNSIWHYDNIYAGRVATRCFSGQYGSYWWPRRKWDGRIQRKGLSGGEEGIGRREYNGQATERRVYDTPKDIGLVETLPKRSKTLLPGLRNDRIPGTQEHSRNAENTSHLEDVKEYEDHPSRDDSSGERNKMATNSNPSVEIPDPPAPKRRGRPPKINVEKKATVPRHDEGRCSNLASDRAAEVTNADPEPKRRGRPRKSKVAAEEKSSVSPETSNLDRWMKFEDIPEKLSRVMEVHDQGDSETHAELSRMPKLIPGVDQDSLDSEPSKETGDLGNSDPLTRKGLLQIPEPSPTQVSEDEELEEALGQNRLSLWRPLVRPGIEPEIEREPVSKTIHILGLGAVGKYIAHNLAGQPDAPLVTLLMHRPLLMQQWHDEGAAIRLLKNGKIHVRSGFHIESSAGFQRMHPYQRFPGFGKNLEHTAEPPTTAINALIVTTDANTTIPALLNIKHRLRQSTTIFIVQDGLGIVEKINEAVFPDSHRRPTYILGNMTHKLASTERTFTIIENQPGSISCSKLPQDSITKTDANSASIRRLDFSWTPQARHLVGALSQVPDFDMKTVGHKSFYKFQLEKLAINAIIGPMSVMFDCTNDQLLYNYNASKTMELLLKEISQVLRALPELQSLRNINEQFSLERLQAIVVSSLKKSGKNHSSMVLDVRAGKKTDIDFYNGYLVKRGAEMGIDCPRNEMIVYTVKAKQAMKAREKNDYVPFRDEY
jgi:2-dehydropantoate 2-reductase